MYRRKWLILLLVVSLVLALDQFSKAWVLSNLQLGDSLRPIPLLYPFFQITFSSNTGAAFGIFPDASTAFLILGFIICGVIVYFYWKTENSAVLMLTGLSLVMGGAVGNIIDRLQHGYVVDFVHLTIPGLVSNVSNFADHAIVLGVMVLLIDSVLHPAKPANNSVTEAPPSEQ